MPRPGGKKIARSQTKQAHAQLARPIIQTFAGVLVTVGSSRSGLCTECVAFRSLFENAPGVIQHLCCLRQQPSVQDIYCGKLP